MDAELVIEQSVKAWLSSNTKVQVQFKEEVKAREVLPKSLMTEALFYQSIAKEKAAAVFSA